MSATRATAHSADTSCEETEAGRPDRLACEAAEIAEADADIAGGHPVDWAKLKACRES